MTFHRVKVKLVLFLIAKTTSEEPATEAGPSRTPSARGPGAGGGQSLIRLQGRPRAPVLQTPCAADAAHARCRPEGQGPKDCGVNVKTPFKTLPFYALCM